METSNPSETPHHSESSGYDRTHNVILQILSMSLLDPSHSPSLLSHSDTTFFTSGVLCLAATSAVLVFTVMANVAHAFLLYVEQALYATDVAAYMTLSCSPKIMATMLISAWLGPLALAFLPLLPGKIRL